MQQKTEPVHSNSIWSNLVSSTSITSSDADDKRKIHKCDFPSCDKVYTKSSHLKAHKREDPIDLALEFIFCSLKDSSSSPCRPLVYWGVEVKTIFLPTIFGHCDILMNSLILHVLPVEKSYQWQCSFFIYIHV